MKKLLNAKNKTFATVIAIFLNAVCGNSQNLQFSAEIKTSQDAVLKEITTLWENYFNLGKDTATNLYWNSQEITDGYSDIIKHILGSGFNIYKYGEHFTFNIRKIEENVYEINTLIKLKRSDDKEDIPFIYKLCAVKDADNYKLANYFSVKKKELHSYSTRHIDYYYPCSYDFNPDKANQIEQRLTELVNDYNVKLDKKIKYIVANSFSENNELIGFPYSIMHNYNKVAGFFIFPNFVVSCRNDHLHELVHVAINSNFPGISGIISEGIATFYGGSGGITFAEQKPLLRKFIADNPDINLADFYSYSRLIDSGFNPFYTVGALLIEHAMQTGGIAKVREIFAYPEPEDILVKSFQIPKEKIHSFIYRLIFDYHEN